MSNRVSMEFGRMGYESLEGRQDTAGNSFMMVSPELRTTSFDEQPYDPSQEHINPSKLELERRGIYTADAPRDGKIRKGLLQLTQDPEHVTEYLFGAKKTNRLINNGFGYVIEGRLNPSHEWVETHTIMEPWERFTQTREHSDPESLYRTRMQTVDLFPEMRVKVKCHPSGRGSLQWLYGVGRSEPRSIIRITLIY